MRIHKKRNKKSNIVAVHVHSTDAKSYDDGNYIHYSDSFDWIYYTWLRVAEKWREGMKEFDRARERERDWLFHPHPHSFSFHTVYTSRWHRYNFLVSLSLSLFFFHWFSFGILLFIFFSFSFSLLLLLLFIIVCHTCMFVRISVFFPYIFFFFTSCSRSYKCYEKLVLALHNKQMRLYGIPSHKIDYRFSAFRFQFSHSNSSILLVDSLHVTIQEKLICERIDDGTSERTGERASKSFSAFFHAIILRCDFTQMQTCIQIYAQTFFSILYRIFDLKRKKNWIKTAHNYCIVWILFRFLFFLVTTPLTLNQSLWWRWRWLFYSKELPNFHHLFSCDFENYLCCFSFVFFSALIAQNLNYSHNVNRNYRSISNMYIFFLPKMKTRRKLTN